MSVNTLGNMDLSATLNMGISSTANFNTTCGALRTDTTTLLNNQINLAGKTTTTTGENEDNTLGHKLILALPGGIDLNPGSF